jgi:hypothetical protein
VPSQWGCNRSAAAGREKLWATRLFPHILRTGFAQDFAPLPGRDCTRIRHQAADALPINHLARHAV